MVKRDQVDHPLGWGLWLAVLAMALALAACGGPPPRAAEPPEVVRWRVEADQAQRLAADPTAPDALRRDARARWLDLLEVIGRWERTR